jgi:hypothetical protein
MNVEEKAVFECLEDEENVHVGAYEELEEDFMLMLNDGKPALEIARKMDPPPVLDSTHENAGVIVLKDDGGDDGEGEGLMGENMIPNYKEKMTDVIAMLDKQKEIRQQFQENRKEAKNQEEEAIQAVN